MKTKLSTVLAAALLAAGFAAPALADQTVLVPLTYVSGIGSLAQKGSFSDVIASAGAFVDTYIFNSPPPIANDTFTAAVTAGVTFSSVQLLTFGTDTVNPISGTITSTSISEASVGTVSSALYELVITGTAQAGGSYSGTIMANVVEQTPPPVPEPASWALMVLGLTATGAFVRRRRGLESR